MSSEQEAYMAEILDHLDALEQDLVDYEHKAAESGASALIHSMFRSAHSLKSALGMGGFPVSSKMLHNLENIMDRCRNTGDSLDPGVVDEFLVVLDITRKNLGSAEETSYDLSGSDSPAAPSREEPSNATAAGGRWQLHKTVKTSLSAERFGKLPVFRNIAAIGTLVSADPPPESWDTAQETVTVTLTFESAEPETKIREVISDPFQPVKDPASSAVAQKQVSTEPDTPGSNPPSDLKILIVEDDFATRHLEASVLGPFGSCDVAVDGREAVDAFRQKLLDNDTYNLVILDINLPEMSGREVLQSMRSLEADHGVAGLDRSRIAVVSSVSEADSIRKSFKDQADAYVIKPITRKKVVEELLRLHLI